MDCQTTFGTATSAHRSGCCRLKTKFYGLRNKFWTARYDFWTFSNQASHGTSNHQNSRLSTLTLPITQAAWLEVWCGVPARGFAVLPLGSPIRKWLRKFEFLQVVQEPKHKSTCFHRVRVHLFYTRLGWLLSPQAIGSMYCFWNDLAPLDPRAAQTIVFSSW